METRLCKACGQAIEPSAMERAVAASIMTPVAAPPGQPVTVALLHEVKLRAGLLAWLDGSDVTASIAAQLDYTNPHKGDVASNIVAALENLARTDKAQGEVVIQKAHAHD